ncbi:hypothetical protein [Aliikangiella maris]|uniref:Uncharacterized protein n=2 Tax=Aliikangiella maris TaxID=3162458 RepID=A0ABV3MPP5_9GAMM
MEEFKVSVELGMSQVRLGVLDEFAMMILFGNYHSQFLTKDVKNNPSQIKDGKGNILYPAYFMTHLQVPIQKTLNRYQLWDRMELQVDCKRYGDTILESKYQAQSALDTEKFPITMNANSLFILDPAIYRSHKKQVSVPDAKTISEMEKLAMPPESIRDAAQIRTKEFADASAMNIVAPVFKYRLESGRDTDPGHPLVFAKMPDIMAMGERELLRYFTQHRISEEVLDCVCLLERKTFYYANAFAGSELSLFSKCFVEPLQKSLWPENPRFNYLCRIVFQTEMYDAGELLAISRAEKVIVCEMKDQMLMQDIKRLFIR